MKITLFTPHVCVRMLIYGDIKYLIYQSKLSSYTQVCDCNDHSREGVGAKRTFFSFPSLSFPSATMATTATPTTETHYRSPRRPARFHYKPRHNPKAPPTPPSPLTLKCGFCKEVKRQVCSRNDIKVRLTG